MFDEVRVVVDSKRLAELFGLIPGGSLFFEAIDVGLKRVMFAESVAEFMQGEKVVVVAAGRAKVDGVRRTKRETPSGSKGKLGKELGELGGCEFGGGLISHSEGAPENIY